MGITRLRLRFPSPALIIACLALFAALGGGAFAATQTRASGIHFTNAKLKNGWTKALGSGVAPAGYAKDSSGIVHLRGEVTGGSDSASAFVLPQGMRPKHHLYIPLNTCAYEMGQLTVLSDGEVEPSGGLDTCQASLDGISFAAGE